MVGDALLRLADDGGQVAVDLDGETRSVSGGDWADRPLAWTMANIIYVATENQRDGPHHRPDCAGDRGEATTVWEGRATTLGVVAVVDCWSSPDNGKHSPVARLPE